MIQVLTRVGFVLLATSLLCACADYRPFEGQYDPLSASRAPYRVAQADPAPTPGVQTAVSAPPTQMPATVDAAPLAPAQTAPSNSPAYVTPSTPPAPPVYPQQPPPSYPVPQQTYPQAYPTAPPAYPVPQQTYPPPPPAYPPPQQAYPPPPVYPTPQQPPQAPAYVPPLAPAYVPPPAPVSPRIQTITKTTVTGKLVEVDGPGRSYTVEKGDALDAIGRKLEVERKVLAELNGLKEPYRLHPGQVLKGPPVKRKAYVVGAGDTLYSIGRRFNVSAKALAAENGLKPGSGLKSGQRVRLPENYRDGGPIKVVTRVAVPAAPPPPQYATPVPVAPPPAPVPRPTPALMQPAPVQPTPAQQPAAPKPPAAPTVSTPPLTDTQIANLGRGRFVWPIRGETLSTFGPKTTGQRNDGLDIRVRDGEPVRAAAGGEVVYSGDQVPGFGNLVLVKHANGWVTAYGHLGRADVKMQQRVAQGQQIGLAGSTGGVSEPQLHFEVRYASTPTERARPIDPVLVLPK